VFDSIGWGEVLVLALAALFIFGPEKLPHIAKDAAALHDKAHDVLTHDYANDYSRSNRPMRDRTVR